MKTIHTYNPCEEELYSLIIFLENTMGLKIRNMTDGKGMCLLTTSKIPVAVFKTKNIGAKGLDDICQFILNV